MVSSVGRDGRTYLNELNTSNELVDGEKPSESGNVLRIWNAVITILNFGMTVSKDTVEIIRTNREVMFVDSSTSLLFPAVGVVVVLDVVVDNMVTADTRRYDKLYLSYFHEVTNHKTANKNSGTSTSFDISLALFPWHVWHSFELRFK